MENRIHKNPRVDSKNGIVCAYHKSLNMYSFYKMTRKGEVSKGTSLPAIITDDFSEAVDRANETSPVKIHKTKFRTVVTSMKGLRSWNEYIELAWKNK